MESSTKNIKIVFFGTSDRSRSILDELNKEFDLVLCITKKDAKVGRKQETKECGVKTWAKENKIEYLEVDSLKDENLKNVVEKLQQISPNYGVVADFSYMIPEEIINVLKNKIVNVHFSILPKHRGASPVQFAILNGEKTTGVTFHLVEKGLDTGDILATFEYNIPDKITSGELYDELFLFCPKKLSETIKRFHKGEIEPKKQGVGDISYTYSTSHPKSTHIYKEDSYILPNEKAEIVERKVRAYNPWPIAWCKLEDLEKAKWLKNEIFLKNNVNKGLIVKIYETELVEDEIEIKTIQVEGKNKMNWKEFKNGYLK